MPPSRAAVTYSHQVQSQTTSHPEYTQDEIFSASCEYAKDLMSNLRGENDALKSTMQESVPKLNMAEFSFGKILGRGTFGVVREIVGISNGSVKSKKNKVTPKEDKTLSVDKTFISEQCLGEDGSPRFVVKYLSDEVMRNHEVCYRAIMDMCLDAHFLLTMDHPCIMKIRAISACGPFHQDNFILMDRLSETLEKKLAAWNKKYSKLSLLLKSSKKKNKIYDDRVSVAYDLLSALEYLHSHQIVHRDLKPENIGFLKNQVQIFDFGLAKSLEYEKRLHNSLYKLTGNTGSCRYMAPEVFKCEPYNESVDLYSFGVLLWQIMSTETPYENFNLRMLRDYVINEEYRPKTNDGWPKVITSLMQDCWSSDIAQRPNAKTAKSVLRKELIRLRGGDDSEIGITSRGAQ